MSDLIDRKTLKKMIEESCFGGCGLIDNAPSAWIPVKTRPCTDEEYEDLFEPWGYDIPREEVKMFDCPMPDDGQEILISSKRGFVGVDICYREEDNVISLESNEDFENIAAWMPYPEPYKREADNEN